MIYIRGHRSDFDGWAHAGNTGWEYDAVLPYFLKAEHNARYGAPYHSVNSPYTKDLPPPNHSKRGRLLPRVFLWRSEPK